MPNYRGLAAQPGAGCGGVQLTRTGQQMCPTRVTPPKKKSLPKSSTKSKHPNLFNHNKKNCAIYAKICARARSTKGTQNHKKLWNSAVHLTAHHKSHLSGSRRIAKTKRDFSTASDEPHAVDRKTIRARSRILYARSCRKGQNFRSQKATAPAPGACNDGRYRTAELLWWRRSQRSVECSNSAELVEVGTRLLSEFGAGLLWIALWAKSLEKDAKFHRRTERRP